MQKQSLPDWVMVWCRIIKLLRFQQNALLEILSEYRTDVKLYWHHWKQQSPALQQLTQTILEQAEQHLNYPIPI
ncbi:hypothetical protein Q8G43_11295 [Acinetobacter schindleri]|uniref:hypothetical protein n=1 Tax=Acinetobacter sp. SM1B TaxID=1497337 RepID=UPI0011BE67E6|nr:hypothetical protein [Acinetobacter sp. SM1B]MDP1445536.1 hypothetical protein [Acinetobacter schindleri]